MQWPTEDFENRLRKVWKHTSKLAARQNISCFRFYDHDLPQYPFAIDFYEGAVHMAEYKRRHGMEEEEHDAWLKACLVALSGIIEVAEENIFLKQRQRKPGRLGQYQKFAEETVERIVHENGLSFILNLTDYLDTGLFLDHRITRGMVKEIAAGKRILNLFCYTGSFSVYAGSGGASKVTSVDLSNTYINWTKRNLQYNKLFQAGKQELVAADVLEWMKTAKSGDYDIIVCDPPTFSNSKKMDAEFDVQRDHVVLLKELTRLCAAGGKIFFSNNYTGFELDRESFPGISIKDITAQTTPFDFTGKLKRSCFLFG